MATRIINPINNISTAFQHGLGNQLVSLVLFGSRARGDAHIDSDWDVLLIAHGLPSDAFDRHLLIKQLLPTEIRGAVSVLARTPQEFEHSISSLYLDIAMDGVVVFDCDDFIHRRLNILRELTQNADLIRKRSPSGDVWLAPKCQTPYQPLAWPLQIS